MTPNTSQPLSHLSPQAKRRLLAQLLKAQQDERLTPILPVHRGTPLATSFAQQRLWLLDQMGLMSGSYNLPIALDLDGTLDQRALEQSLTEILHRHETLRTCFTEVDGEPLQRILPPFNLELPIQELRELSPEQQEHTIERIASREYDTLFDLAQGPLFRAQLLRLGETRHRLIVTFHHIASDTWSIGVFCRELAALYDAFSQGQPSPLPELPIQYADFAAWQCAQAQSEVFTDQLNYWTTTLQDLSTLQLPIDYPRPPVQTFQGATQRFEIDANVTSALQALSRRHGVTLFVTLLAAFQALLHRYTGQTRIPVGAYVSGRSRTELETLIGFFVNSVVLNTEVNGHTTVVELLSRVREVLLEAQTHQEIPFTQVVEALQPMRSLSHNPLFQVTFDLRQWETIAPDFAMGKVNVHRLEVNDHTARFDLEVYLWRDGAKLQGRCTYNTALFDDATVSRLQDHFQTLLANFATCPEQWVSQLTLMSASERRHVLTAENPGRPKRPDSCLHELFESQARQTPSAIAVTDDEHQLTYRTLNQRANQLARYLKTIHVGPGVLVGIYMARSLDMIIGLLGILKAGGAYLPLEPSHPQERLSFMIEEGQLAVILSHDAVVDAMPPHAARVVRLDADWPRIARERGHNLAREVGAEQLAYVIYTSGSTGQPKGVQLPHRAVVNFLLSMRQELDLTDRDVLLAITTLSFDISILELCLPLVMGAQVVIASHDTAMSGERLARQLAQVQATVMQATPTTWRLLLDAGWRGKTPFTVLCGGEALPPELAHQLVRCADTVWNLYGPTETAIYSIITKLTPANPEPHLGHPIANTQIYILDRYGEPTPLGVPGELYIGGAGVARGYLKRPDLTAHQFVPHHLGAVAGALLYKTGDRVRRRREGGIDFLGRLDNQVKIRGFRIELGDIEAALAQHPDVHEAVITAHVQSPEQSALVAYVTSTRHPAPTPDALYAFLQTKLPTYMIPSVFVRLDAFPLTPNGKIDRRVLPPPSAIHLSSEPVEVAPYTPTEDKLIAIWSDILGCDRMSIHDNFFTLGGHSLLGVRLLSRIRQVLSIELSLRSLFEAPTVAAQADAIDTLCWATQGLPTDDRAIPDGRQEGTL